MAHAIAVTAKTAAEAAQEVNDHDDDEYQSERHGTLPEGGRRVKTRRSAAEEKSIYRPLVPVREPGMASPVIPGWSEGPDLRCAVAHRGISRFRVRCGACRQAALRADPLASPGTTIQFRPIRGSSRNPPPARRSTASGARNSIARSRYQLRTAPGSGPAGP